MPSPFCPPEPHDYCRTCGGYEDLNQLEYVPGYLKQCHQCLCGYECPNCIIVDTENPNEGVGNLKLNRGALVCDYCETEYEQDKTTLERLIRFAKERKEALRALYQQPKTTQLAAPILPISLQGISPIA